EKSERLTFPPRLEIRQKSPDFHIPTAPTATLTSQLPKRLHIRNWQSLICTSVRCRGATMEVRPRESVTETI
ncbi:MAG: hypothetical protein ABSB82_20040, partial [Terriglobia bacterium]